METVVPSCLSSPHLAHMENTAHSHPSSPQVALMESTMASQPSSPLLSHVETPAASHPSSSQPACLETPTASCPSSSQIRARETIVPSPVASPARSMDPQIPFPSPRKLPASFWDDVPSRDFFEPDSEDAILFINSRQLSEPYGYYCSSYFTFQCGHDTSSHQGYDRSHGHYWYSPC
jgi:hypothetical protein